MSNPVILLPDNAGEVSHVYLSTGDGELVKITAQDVYHALAVADACSEEYDAEMEYLTFCEEAQEDYTFGSCRRFQELQDRVSEAEQSREDAIRHYMCLPISQRTIKRLRAVR